MNESTLSDLVARKLSELWRFYRTPEFLEYLLVTYKASVSENPTFEKICIAEAENGDIEFASIGGIIKRWWVIDDGGLRTVKKPDKAHQEVNVFDPHPVVKFYMENNKIIIGERLGPDLISRKRATVTEQGGDVVISDLVVTWTCNP